MPTLIGTLWQDTRYGVRTLGRNPGFTGIAILTLALGIGATSTIFAVVNAVLLRPLPFRDPDRLIAISQTSQGTGASGAPVSFTKFQAIQEQDRSLAGVAVYYTLDLSLGGQTEPARVAGARVSGDLFGLLGTAPALGRGFSPEEQAPGGEDVALISNGLWRRRFGGDPGLLGKGIRLDGKNVTVVGILAPGFRFPLETPEPDVWMPRAFEPDFLTPAQVHSGAGYLSLIARLRPGRTIAQAQSDLAAIDARYNEAYGSYVDAAQFRLRAASLTDSLVGASRPSLLVLLAAVGFVLLIACANVASLQLARATGRAGEMAVRKAIGASRSRLVGQLLIESLGLSLVGGALGVGLAAGAVRLAQGVATEVLPRLEQARLDGTVLLFSLGLCAATALAFGVVPALHASRGDLQDGLRHGGRGSSDGVARRRLRALFVAEAAVAVVLLTGAGLLIRSLVGLLSVDPGFEPQGVVTIPIDLPTSRYAEPARQADFFRQLLARIDGIPGVRTAAATSYLPLSGSTRFVFFCPEGRACQGIGKDPVIAQRQVTPDYFEATRTRVLRGRVFAQTDAADTPPVVIVNETTARRYWPGVDPLGKHLANSRDRVQREIVGVVADVKFRALSAPSVEEMYLPLAQSPWPTMTLLVRSDSDPRPLVAAVRQEIAHQDPDIAIQGVRSMAAVVRESVAQPQLVVGVVAVFATLALLLAAVGIYGVMAYSVAERTREFGVRMALGSSPRAILRLVLREGMGLALSGVVLGLVSSLVLTRLLASLLFGVTATDPLSFAGAACVLVATALLACYVPARRGMRLEAVRALREE
jgi:putative ABC transport system permease protein